MNIACIIIPIYKEKLNNYELISLTQCFKIHSKHKKIFVCPENLDTSFYEKFGNENYSFEYFDEDYFKDISGYNRLMLTIEFYKRFIQYDYMLIYQSDAFVFRDELEYWCNQGYDFIGAPWFQGFGSAELNAPFLGVGNGGFSLRKIITSINLLEKTRKLTKLYNVLKKYKIIGVLRRLGLFQNQIKTLGSISNTKPNEDYYIFKMTQIFKNYKIAPIAEAIKFSFEEHPAYLYEKNEKKLPFGCHAWERYDLDFWKPFIEKRGYTIDEKE